MCGIAGISYGPEGSAVEDWTPTEFMQLMFPAIVHRGPHAFGWMWYDGESVWYQKYEGKVTDHMGLVGFDGSVDESKIQWLVMHVRYATHGSPSYEGNNHPIQHGSIMGVHNGVIRNHDEILDETGRHDPLTEVDSEAIFAAIDTWGHRAGLRRIRGDMVTVYTNLEKPATLHIARSNGRQLETCKTPHGAFLFASEGGVIDATKVEHTTFSPVSRNRLLRVRGGKVLERITFVKEPAPGTGKSFMWEPGMRERATERAFPDRSAPSWFSETMRANRERTRNNPVVINANLMADREKRQHQSQRLREAAKDPRSRNLRDHDRFGEFYYLGGILMTEASYMAAVADLDQAVSSEGE